MFEKYMIVPEKAKNIEKEGKTIGFQFGARLPYYRGLGLSMVEDIQIKIDNQPVNSSTIRLSLNGNSYTLLEMEDLINERWEIGEIATITIDKEGGLASGDHQIDVLMNLRISYMPFPSIRTASKSIEFND